MIDDFLERNPKMSKENVAPLGFNPQCEGLVRRRV
jgi:hypothetical protein